MNTNTTTQAGPGQSAKIYQFPVGGRRAPSSPGHREVADATELMALRISDAVVSGCWYHDEAIQQATAPVKS